MEDADPGEPVPFPARSEIYEAAVAAQERQEYEEENQEEIRAAEIAAFDAEMFGVEAQGGIDS